MHRGRQSVSSDLCWSIVPGARDRPTVTHQSSGSARRNPFSGEAVTRRPSRWIVTAVEMTTCGGVLAVVYTQLYFVQRGMFLNGVPVRGPYDSPRLEADTVAALDALHRYWLLMAVCLMVFAWVLARSSSLDWRRMGWLPLLMGGLGNLAALPARPSLSIDALSYLSHGWLAGNNSNPYQTPSSRVADAPYGASLLAQGWLPVHPQTPYGPAWTHIERLAYLLAGDDVGRGLLLLKSVVVIAVLAGSALIWLVARRLRPRLALTATVAYLWNPVVVIEFAMDGHNDSVAIAFAILGIWLALTGRAFWAVCSLGLGALTKFTPALFAIPVLVFLIRRSHDRVALLIRLVVGAGVVLAVSWLLYRPFWTGVETFEGLASSGTPLPSWSPAGWASTHVLDPATGLPDPRVPIAFAVTLLVVTVCVSWRRTEHGLLAACATIAVLGLAVAPNYWPWYSALPIALLSASASRVAMLQVVALTAGSRIAAPYGDLFVIGVLPFRRAMELATLWGVNMPVLCCALLGIGAALSRRRMPY